MTFFISHTTIIKSKIKEFKTGMYHIFMEFFHKKYKCELDGEKFDNYDELIEHSRQVHHLPILECHKCKKKFLHEKDRLHHVREEHDKEMDARVHKSEHSHKKGGDHHGGTGTPQDEVDSHMRNFGDNF